MGDHLWPALYPGIIVGLLYGLSLRGVWNPPLGAVGGLLGAALAVAVYRYFNIEEGLLTAAVTVAFAAVGAFGATHAKEWLTRARQKSSSHQ